MMPRRIGLNCVHQHDEQRFQLHILHRQIVQQTSISRGLRRL